MQFTKLRLSGFKSFVDPIELHVETGLTSIVGPNGCGKSNLVEALGWVMGETSAKQMRGGAMDDVIFNGTQTRPPRNVAEVALTIDNSSRAAPAAFNDTDELTVSRKIERDTGSTYRIKGREVRARDVQLLFADAASGAHSPALVSQGRVGAVVNARPIDRRALLEEAAGITGLHSRRHEAELRLRGASANLERLDDVMMALEGQLQGIKRQARQANRYRRIGSHIRRFEAIQLHLRHGAAAEAAEDGAARLAAAERTVAELTRQAARAQNEREEAVAALPGLRQREAEASARLHRLAVALDGLEAEERRIAEHALQLQARHGQLDEDEARERLIESDANAAFERLEQDRVALERAREGEHAAGQDAQARIEAAAAAVTDQEVDLERLTELVATDAARRDGLAREIADAERRSERLKTRQREAQAEAAEIAEALGQETGVRQDAAALAAAEESAEATTAALDAAEATRAEREADLARARDALQQIDHQAAELSAEEAALAALLEVNTSGLWAPLIDAVKVQQGFEAALGAALGDDLNVPTDEGAPVHWLALDPDPGAPALPAGAEPLDRYVKAPPALARRLSQVGVVSAAEGSKLRRRLQQGQRLVNRDGALWRWDGFTVTAGAETTAAARLAQRNRLADLRGRRDAVSEKLAAARADFEAAEAEVEAARQACGQARESTRTANAERYAARQAFGEAERTLAANSARRATLDDVLAQLQGDIAEAESQRQQAATTLAELPESDGTRRRLQELRGQVAELRANLADARNDEAQFRREVAARGERLSTIVTEQRGWAARAADAGRQLETLGARRRQVTAELAEARRKPAEIQLQRDGLLDEIGRAESERDHAADALATRERLVDTRDKALRVAEQALASGREERVRIEAMLEAACERLAELVHRIRETLDCDPDAVLETAGIAPGEALPALAEAEARLERLLRERDNMGPVNLRAEQEAEELGEQLDGMRTERADLEAAIQRLRQGIQSLNREGRERLLAAFQEVDAHFQDLFVRLFGGGRAHLALTEADDPLEAGLEIMASPPGKRLQTLSLLSGGEQALTALALLFAVFLTNPAPICVLDEVDAPLDDANVERFCNLVREIARVTGTRFLIITHHPFTMAQVDRLYGVTMSERGVSVVVSVDLARAERLRASA